MPSDTNNFYDTNAALYESDTGALDMSPFYSRFEKLIPHPARILDAGCGTGRDSKYFLSRGHIVVAFDSSTAKCELARKNAGINVKRMRFQDVSFENEFDGIWACASLLHVPSSELTGVMTKLKTALRDGGVLYCSFKYGTFSGERNGRYFNDMDEAKFATTLQGCGMNAIEMWVTDDLRAGREGERWLNAIVKGSYGSAT